MASSSSSPMTWQLFGSVPEARLLIINADDFGVSHSVNEAVLRAWSEGVVSSTSLMVPCPWAAGAMAILRDHPDLPFAVHLTMVCEYADYRWGPVAPISAVSSLVDARGHFLRFSQRETLLVRARIDEIEREFRAQIEVVLDAGLRPTHLDWHTLADGGRNVIFELTVALAREYGLALRTHFAESVASCRERGLPVADHGVLDSYSIPPETKPERYHELLRALPAGVSEWAVHPALGDEEARALEPDSWRVRRSDYDFLVDPYTRDFLAAERITVTDFRPLQNAWRSASGSASA